MSSILLHAKLLEFSNDMKLFLRIGSLSEYELLQADINRLVFWREALNLKLNVSKYQTMTFARRSNISIFNYTIYGSTVTRSVNSVRGLGFRLCSNLCSCIHIVNIYCKALKLLGFVKSIIRNFKFSISFKSLYCALVRSILECGSVLWGPQTSEGSTLIEWVLKKSCDMLLSYSRFHNLLMILHQLTTL